MPSTAPLRPVCWTLLLIVVMAACSAADDSMFCLRPANMELCWWNNVSKRYLRFGRGDPFLRFGRSKVPSWMYNPFNHFGKRSTDTDADTDSPDYLDNGGYLRFGRSVSQQQSSPLMALLSQAPEGGAASRKRRDVSKMVSHGTEMERTARDVKDGGFLRFGRREDPESINSPTKIGALPFAPKQGPSPQIVLKGLPPKGFGPFLRLPATHDGHFASLTKDQFLRMDRASREGYLRFGKRSLVGV